MSTVFHSDACVKAADAPIAGILSRTVFQSPMTERILTGRIRDSESEDAIFIGRDVVHVKEQAHNGQLCTLASLADFGSRIAAAGIIGKRSSPVAEAGQAEIKLENGHAALLRPPHSLVLLLEARELMFLTMSLDINQAWQFHHVRYPLDLAANDLERWNSVAIDPRSRAMAVASVSGRVSLLALSESLQVQHTFLFDSGISILLMDFIFPSASDDSIYLMLVGRKQHRFCCLVYAWDSRQHFTDNEPYCYTLDANHPPPSMLIPLASYPGAFALGALQRLTVYKNAHVRSIQKTAESSELPIFFPESSRNPESRYEQPPWANWARASRWYTNSDCLYISREDGIVYNVQIGTGVESLSHNLPTSLDELTFVRCGMPHYLRGNIGGAFTTYEPANGTVLGPDTILFAGDLSDGAHYEIGQRKHEDDRKDQETTDVLYWKEMDSFYNWAPFLAVAVVPPTTRLAKDSSRRAFEAPADKRTHERRRIFGTSGKGAWGAVSELRVGWEFIISETLLPQDLLHGANSAWSMRNIALGWQFDFISTPFSTVAINWIDGSVHLETFSLEPTLTMVFLKSSANLSLPQSLILQVTPTAVVLWKADEDDDADEEQGFTLQLVQSWKHEAIVVSAIHAATGLLVLAVRQHGTIKIMLKRLGRLDETTWKLDLLGEAISSNDVPTCMDIFLSSAALEQVEQEDDTLSDCFVAIGTDTGKLLCYRLDLDNGFQQAFVTSLTPGIACESLCITSSPQWSGLRGVCGLRNGSVAVFGLYIENQQVAFPTNERKTFDMGTASPSIKVTKSTHGPGCYVFGGGDTCYLSLKGASLDNVTMDNVWLTDRANRSLSQLPMAAVCQVSYAGEQRRHPYTTLLLDANAQAYFGSLTSTIEPLPRRIPVLGTPNRLIHSSYLQCLVVASTVIEIDPASHKRFESSVIILMDPDGEAEESEAESTEGAIGIPNSESQVIYYLDNAAERILCLTEWQVEKGESKHHFVVVGTSVQDSNGGSSGFIHLFQFRLNESGLRGLKLMKSCRESRPVGAVCAWDEKTLLYCAGNQIRKRTVTFEAHDIGLVKTRLFQMSSAGVYLDQYRDDKTDDPIICVTSLQGSTRLLRFNADESMLESFASDSKSRAGLCHAILRSSNLVVSSSKDHTIIGISISDKSGAQHAGTPIFECKLPASITRFVYDSIRPPWKQSRRPDEPATKDLIGVATDGSLLSFRLLGEQSWRLLRFVANMAVRDARLCRLQQAQPGILQREHIEPLDSDPRAHHVDGDLLARLLSMHDAHAVLNELLSKRPAEGPTFPGHREVLAGIDFESAQARRARFEELVEATLWSLVDQEGLDAQQEVAQAGNDPVMWVVRYMKRILEMPF